MPEELQQEEIDNSDAVLLAFSYARDAGPGDKTLLREWTARYPAIAEELMTVDYARFAAGMTLTDVLEDGPEDAAIAALGAEVLATRQASAARLPLTSLLDEAAARGMDGPQLAQTLRLDRLTLGRLEQRALDAATLPLALVRQIGAVLERSADEVAAFLRGGPRLPAQAHFLARRAPSVAPAPASSTASPARPLSFGQAVQGSRSLSAEDKAYWRAELDAGVLGE